jgi:hypothetical protein
LYLLMAIHALAVGGVLIDGGLLRNGHCGGFPLNELSGVRFGRAALWAARRQLRPRAALVAP